MSKVAPHVAAAIAAGLRARGPVQAKPAGDPAAASHVAGAIAAGRGPGQVAAGRPPVVQRAAARRAQADFLRTTSTNLFNATADGSLMEVQSAIFDGRMFVSSNYTRGNNDAALAAQLPVSYAHAGTTYNRGREIVRLAGTVHAEQAILLELAKVIRNPNKANPAHVTVIGSKRPCSVCRRVLIAFNRALLAHYPGVHLHWIDQTGADTLVDPISLDDLAAGTTDQDFKDFAATYTAELAKVVGKRLPGEDVSNATRTAAVPDLDDLM